MAVINKIITAQAFEIIRDRIATILDDEINNQAQLTYDPILDNTDVVVEKTNFDKVDLQVVNVSIAAGTYSNKNQGSVDGSYEYNIDVFSSAKTSSLGSGEQIAAFRMQKLIGLCRYILEDPKYKTLGYSTPFISRVYVSAFNIRQNNQEDALNTAMGRLTFNVVANESNTLITPYLIEGYNTVMTVNNTNKGYFWEGNSYP